MNDIFTQRISRILLILFFMLTGFNVFAQYTKTSLETGRQYTAMTKDQSGNLYIVRSNAANNGYELVKYTNGTGTPAVIYSNLKNDGSVPPIGLAVNALGDVFVTNLIDTDGDPNNFRAWQIIKLTAPSYAASVIHEGDYYSALAVDPSNNLLAIQWDGGSNYKVVRYPFGAEQLAGTDVYNQLPLPAPGEISPTYPSGLVTDSHGNIFVSDFHNNSGGRIIKLTAPGFTGTPVQTGRGFTSLAVDASDNLYAIEQTATPNVSQIVKYSDPTQPGQVLTATPAFTLSYDLNTQPWGLAVMSNGNIFANNGLNTEVVKLAPPTINVTGVVAGGLSPTSASTVTYTVNFSGSATNVTQSSFTLTTGVAGAGITSVTGSGNMYTVTINTGTGNGTIRLDVNGNGISPTVANAPYTSGAVYIIDRLSPSGSILINGGAAYTNNPNVTLTLTGSDPSTPLQMRFSLDGGTYTAFEPFATTKNLTLPSTEGLRKVTYSLRDAAGNTANYDAYITLDVTQPNTTITGNPANPTNSNNATFAFNSNEPGSTFEASLDAGPYVTVTNPVSYTGLADGNHMFNVRAIDRAGNVDGTPAPYNWDIDATGPQITHVSVPAPEYYHAGQALDFKLQYNEAAIVDQTAGTPYINLIIGLTAVQVPYISGSGTNELTFRYTVLQGEMDMDGVQVQPLVQNNSGSIKDALGNNASTTLNGVDPTSAVRVNTSIPSVTLSFAGGVTMPTNAPFTVQAVFSEPVSGLSVADFNVLNTTLSGLSTSDNITYTVLMTPASDGVRPISLPANIAENIGHNPNTPSNTLTYTYDATAPSVTAVTVPTNKIYRAGETLSFTVNFSEAVNVTGGSPSLGITIGATPVQATFVGYTGTNLLVFSYVVANGDLDMDGITVTTLSLNGATIRDAATNNANLALNNIASTADVKVNTAHPSVAITSAAPAIANAPFTATITFSEAVTGFVAGDITTGNANISNFSGSGAVYTVTVTPVTDGTVTMNIDADVAENIGLNGNTASNTLSRIYDIAPPSVTAVNVPANGYYKAGSIMNFTVRFSENITLNTSLGNPSLSFLIGTTLVQTTFAGLNGTDGLNFSYTIVNGEMDMDGIEVGDLILNNATIVDIANNAALLDLNGVGNTTGVFVNTQHPSVTLASSAPAIVNTPFTVNVTFSEAVTGLVAGDFTVTNGTAATLTGSNATYTIQVTPASDGPVSITLPADIAVNIGDNGNTASNTLNRDYDGTAPAVTAVAVPANEYYNAGATLDFIVRFNEDLIINTAGGNPTLTLNIGGTTVYAAYTGTNGTNGLNFSYTVLDGQMDMDGIQVVSLNAAGSTIRDAATNDANLTLNSVGNTTNVRVNTTHPTVAISTTATPSVNTPFTVNIAFSENVTGFTSSDVAVTNATVSPVTVIDNANYTVTIVPASEGPVTVNIPVGAAENIGHNGNTASNTLSIIYDITQPQVASVSVPAPKYYRAGEVLNFVVHYDEDVILNLTGGTPYVSIEVGTTMVNAVYDIVASTTKDLHFNYTVVNGDQDMSGIIIGLLELNGSTIKDAANNDADLILYNTANTSGVRVNTTSPAVTLTSTANALVNAPFTVTATFSEAVTVLTESDFSVTNGTLSGLTSPDNITYTVTVTPIADGVVSIQLPANAVVNVGGNANIPSNTLNFTYDGTAPAVNAVFVPINGYYKAGDAMNFTVFFDENINLNTAGGAPYLNVDLTSGTVRADYTVATANSLSFSYTVQPGDMDLNGITLGALNLNGSTIKDDATNNAVLTLNNVANMSQVFVHTGSPSVQLSTTAAARVNAPVTVTATFNEVVSGLTATDFTITNGTAGTLASTDDITYTLVVTPTADGPVTIQLPAGQALNVVSNGNTVSNTLSLTYDATAPAIDGGLAFDVLERSAVGTQVGQATATDASGIIQNWAIASDDSNGAFSIDANGNIKVADQAKLNAKVGTTVTLTVTVSDGLNTSVAAPVTIAVKLVNQSPTLDAIDNETVCPGTEHTIQLTGASAVEPGQTYGFNIITNNASNFDKLSVSATGLVTYQLKPNVTGTSTVTVTIKDNGGIANGGTDTLRRSFSIEVATLGAVTITSDKGTSISKGDVVHLTANGGTIYQWDNADGIISGQQTAVLEVRPMENTTYHVTVSNATGCTNTADFTISVVADFKVDATNLLTPNGDGKNDKWVIRNLDAYPDNEIQIFDRAGRLVYTRRNYSNDWDGTMNGSPLGEGTYYYILKIQGGAKTAKGYITIIRDRN